MLRHPWHRDPNWSSRYDYYHAECHWQLLMDNVFARRLIDLASDAGGVQVRRVFAALAEAEAKQAETRAA
jgi:hypothetical protein